MHPILLYLLKMLLCSGILYGYYRVALYNERFHQWNRFYLLGAMLLSVVVPLVEIPLQAENKPMVIAEVMKTMPWAGMEKVTIQNNSQPWSIEGIARMLALIVSISLFIKLVNGFLGLIRHYREGIKTNMDDVSVILTEDEAAPYSFFNWLFWRKNFDTNTEQGRRMLQHELAHIHQHHTLDKLFTEVLVIVFWMNPVFWLIRKELYMIHEFLADKAAVEENNGPALAEMILQTVHIQQAPLLTNPFFTSQIKRRLFMITTSKKPVFSYLRRISGLVCIALTSFMLVISIQKTQAQTKSNLPTTYDGKKIKEIDIDRTKGTVKLTLENNEKVEKTIKEASEEKILPEKILTGNVLSEMTKADSQKATEWINKTMVRIESLPKDEQKPFLVAITTKGEEIVFGTQNGMSSGVNGNLMPISGLTGFTTEFKKITTGTNPKKPIYIYDGNIVQPDAIPALTEKEKEYQIQVYNGDMAEELYGKEAGYGVVIITPTDSKNFTPTEPGINRMTIRVGTVKTDTIPEKPKE